MSPVRREFNVLTRLALPVVLAQMGTMMLGLVDTWMVGHLGSVELAACALADVILFGSLVIGIGIVMGIDPIVTQAHGAGKGARAGLALQQGIVLAALCAVPLTVVALSTGRLLLWTGQDPRLAELAQTYAEAQAFSIAPHLIFVALRQYMLGRGNMITPLVVVILANLANVLFNWALIFGNWGFPALGIQGAGIATGLTRTLLPVLLAAILFGRGMHRGAWQPWSRASFEGAGLRHVFAYGWPIGLQVGLEVWAFSSSTVFAGWMPAPSVAAHIVVLRLASFAFMVPLGISVAAATRVGNLLGAGESAGAQHAARASLYMGGGVMLLSALVFVVGRNGLASIFTGDPEVIALAATIFPVAAAFQLFDGIQVVGCGVLRGMGTPRPATIFNFVGYYLLAIPIGLYLAFGRDIGVPGLWWGLAAGLAVVAAFLVAWIAKRGPATVRRLAISR